MFSFTITALRASLVTFVLCGLIYPLALTGIAQALLPFQANGSLVRASDGVVLGSHLIGQQWNGAQWFHGRPSATTDSDPADATRTVAAPYNATSSAGSNLGPTNRRLVVRLAADRRALEAAQPELAGRMLPADMLTTSASGLDPEISPANAALQATRVARVCGISAERVDTLLRQQIVPRSLAIFGEPRINVLELNLALRRICAPNAAR
jgi:potassium-transporting ATPase KdpC subunit